jgi:hypothetical protein
MPNNSTNINIFDIATSIGLSVPKNILDYLIKAYGKKKTIDILSETVGYKIDEYNTDVYYFTNSLDFQESNELNLNRFRTESTGSNYSNFDEDCVDSIQLARDNFFEKYLKKLHSINYKHKDIQNFTIGPDVSGPDMSGPDMYGLDMSEPVYQNQIESNEEKELYMGYLNRNKKKCFIIKLNSIWTEKYLMEGVNKSTNQDIIMKAHALGLLDLLDPSFVDNGKLQKAWDIICKYELWIENINGEYWKKLENLMNHEYRYIMI